jgi:hypothetical protein
MSTIVFIKIILLPVKDYCDSRAGPHHDSPAGLPMEKEAFEVFAQGGSTRVLASIRRRLSSRPGGWPWSLADNKLSIPRFRVVGHG